MRCGARACGGWSLRPPTSLSPSPRPTTAGTLYVFINVCAGVLYMRFHQPGSGSSGTPILAALLALVLLALGE